MHKLALHDKPNEDQIMEFSKGFDSHLGKVYIRNYGGQWVMAGINEKSYPGIHCDNNEFYFWPWMKVFHRISIGSENNIWWYYEILIKNNLKTSNFYQDHLKIWWNKFSSYFKAQAFI